MRNLNYHHLYYFYIIAQERSFTKAAERLGVSASSLSLQLKQLEDNLGCSLFERSKGRNISLSPAGFKILEKTQQIFLLGEEILTDLAPGIHPSLLRIACVSGMVKQVQAMAVRTLCEGFANCQIALTMASRDEALNSLASLQVDLVISDRSISKGIYSGLKQIRIFSEPMLLLRKIHMKTKTSEAISSRYRLQEHVEKYGIFIPTKEPSGLSHLEELFPKLDARLFVRGYVEDLAMMRPIALETNAFVVAPAACMPLEISDHKVAVYHTFEKWKIEHYAVALSNSKRGSRALDILSKNQC